MFKGRCSVECWAKGVNGVSQGRSMDLPTTMRLAAIPQGWVWRGHSLSADPLAGWGGPVKATAGVSLLHRAKGREHFKKE